MSSRKIPEGFTKALSPETKEEASKVTKLLMQEVPTTAKDLLPWSKDVALTAGEAYHSLSNDLVSNQPEAVQKLLEQYNIPGELPITAAAFGVLATAAFIAITYGARILSYYVGVLQPLYHTFVALETETKDDDTLWLTYWMVYGVMNLLDETILLPIVSVLPVVYYIAKMAFLFYLVNFDGAVVVYKHVLAPVFREQVEKFEHHEHED